MKSKANSNKQLTDDDIWKKFPRVKHSVLFDLINIAREKYPNVKEKIQQFQVEEELGRLFQRTVEGSRTEKAICKFAEANKLIIIIPD